MVGPAITRKHVLVGSLAALVLVLLVVHHVFHGSNSVGHEAFVGYAVFLDPLSIDYPNTSLAETVISVLEQKGFHVDYYAGRNVSVKLLEEVLSSGKYSVVIIRSHGGHLSGPGLPGVASSAIFTSEEFQDDKYPGMVSAGLLARGTPLLTPNKSYFVATSLFIETYAKINSGLVIVASCYSLSDPALAEAFLRRGARAYIGWRGPVNAAENDAALARLIKDLFEENMTLLQAVRDAYRASNAKTSLLDIVPLEVGDYTVWQLLETGRGE